MEKKLTIAANIAIIIVAVATIVMFVRNDMLARRSAQSTIDPAILIGKQFPLNQPWSSHKKTVVLALHVGCRFCTASAPFYQRLTGYANAHQVNVLALLPDPKEESNQYIQHLGLTISAVPQVSFQKIDVRGTPTLFVVDSRGIVEKVWQGQLPDDEQKKVFSLLD